LLFIVNEEDSSSIPLPKNEMSYLFFLLFYYYFVVRATCGERKKKELFATYSKKISLGLYLLADPFTLATSDARNSSIYTPRASAVCCFFCVCVCVSLS
jgi:hypothetical protein